MAMLTRPLNMDVFQAAEKRILHVFSKHYLVDVCFSGGKDSIATLLMTIKTMQKHGIDFKRLSVTFVDEEAIYPDVPGVVEHYRNMVLSLGGKFYWLCLPWRHYNCTNTLLDEDSWTCWDMRARDKWVRTPPPYALRWHPDFKYGMSYQEFFKKMAAKHDKFVQIIGVRASESVQRLTSFHKMAYQKAASRRYLYKVIYDWKDSDVWKIIMDNNAVFPKTYMNLWRVGAPMRMSQIFAADTCRSIPRLLVFYPGFYEKLQRRCPNIDIVLLYYNTRLFKSSGQSTKHGGNGDEKTLRDQIRKGLADAARQGRRDRGYLCAKRAWSRTERYSGLKLSVYRFILNMLYGGDAKSRTYLAWMIGLNGSLKEICTNEKGKPKLSGVDSQETEKEKG